MKGQPRDAERPVRRLTIRSSDDPELGLYEHLLLPAALLAQGVFVGSTFRTLPITISTSVVAALVVVLVLQRSPHRKDRELEADGGVDNNGNVRRFDHAHGPAGPPGRGDQSEPRRFVGRSMAAAVVAIISALVIVAFRLGHHLNGNVNPVAMFVDSVAHGSYWGSLALWVIFPRRGHPAMLPCGIMLVLATVTAGGVSHSINGQLLAALATVIAFSLASRHILGQWEVIQGTRSRRRRVARRTFAGGRRSRAAWSRLPNSTVTVNEDGGRSGVLLTVLAISLLMMTTSAAGHLASNVVPGLQFEIFERLSRGLEAVTKNSLIGGSRYVRGSHIGQIRQHMIGDPAEPAVRAYAESEPGYLRGTAFDIYRGSSWDVANESSFRGTGDRDTLRERDVDVEIDGRVELEGSSDARLRRFPIHDQLEAPVLGTVEVHNVPTKGKIVFTSLSTEWIEAVARSATITHDDVITNGIDTTSPYVLGVAAESPPDALGPARKEILLGLPRRLREHIVPRAESICEGKLTARAKAEAIEQFFQANFEYSLARTATVPKDVDPLVHFLETRHPAHCEYFASAAAILLRAVNVPTRYVTGYVVSEYSDEESYWLARNRDAHAWVEAYDDIDERWFPVEATVGRRYRTLTASGDQVVDDEVATNDAINDAQNVSLIDRLIMMFVTIRTDGLAYVSVPHRATTALLLGGDFDVDPAPQNSAGGRRPDGIRKPSDAVAGRPQGPQARFGPGPT